MKIRLDDFDNTLFFAPLTLTRPIGDLRCGFFTNTERWEYFDDSIEVYYHTLGYLQTRFENSETIDIIVNAALIPDEMMMASIVALEIDSTLSWNNHTLAIKGSGETKIIWKGEAPLILENRWDLYSKNARAIEQDFTWFTKERNSIALSKTNTLIGDPAKLFIEEGAIVEAAVINVNDGPVYIGVNAEIMEGSLIRGALALMDNAVVKMGAKLYGANTIGPYCKVGGEVGNSVFQAYSNKGHDGYLGNSLIGEWCNLGADTNTSNLKNNYGKVDTFSYVDMEIIQTDQQFMGVCMGDHSKCGINTMFNTATVVGVSCNIYGGDFPEKFIPSFSWGSATEMKAFRLDKAIEYANNMMERRGLQLAEDEIAIFNVINQ